MTSPDDVDVLVVGAGLAGLHTATLLARCGFEVLLVERRPTLTGAIRTTGFFVRRTLEDFSLPAECLGPPIRRVVLYPPSLRRPVTLISARDEYRVADMAGLYVAAARMAVDAGVRIALGTRYVGRRSGRYVVADRRETNSVRARFVVGADGARSRVARDLGLDHNRHLLVGAEEVFEVPHDDQPPAFHCVIDPSVAPGYLAWVVNDGRHAHVGVAGYGERFASGLRRSMQRFAASAPGLDDALRSGEPERLARYDGSALRARFRGRLMLRHGLAQVRTPAVATAVFAVLRTPLGRAAAGRILFGDGSFPSSVDTGQIADATDRHG